MRAIIVKLHYREADEAISVSRRNDNAIGIRETVGDSRFVPRPGKSVFDQCTRHVGDSRRISALRQAQANVHESP